MDRQLLAVTEAILKAQKAGVVENLAVQTFSAQDRTLGDMVIPIEDGALDESLCQLVDEFEGLHRDESQGLGAAMPRALDEGGEEGMTGPVPFISTLKRPTTGYGLMLTDEYILTLATNTAAFALHFFPEHFTRPFSNIHHSIFHFLDDDSALRCAMAAPRGYGKTTIMDVAYAARVSLFGLKKFLIFAANTSSQAELQFKNYKFELESNDLVREFFGDPKGAIWSTEELLLSNEVYVRYRGAGQQIRGLKFRQYRPDVIICDDLESSEMVENEETRKKFKRWFYTDLLRAGKKSGQECKVIVIGTILHQDSLLQNLLDSDLWTSVRLEAFDDARNPTDPLFMSKAEIEALYMEYEAEGMLDELYMEYRNIAVAPATRLFPTVYHRYSYGDAIHTIVDRGINNGSLARCVICDPAKTSTSSSDYSALIGAVIDFPAGLVYFHRIRHHRVAPDVLINLAFDLCDELKTDKLFIEVTGLNEWLTTVVRSMMIQRVQAGGGRLYDVRELKASNRQKQDRIAKLAPLYRTGVILHNGDESAELEAQLMNFPRSKFDDLSDAAAYLIPIIGGSGGWDFQNIHDLFSIGIHGDLKDQLSNGIFDEEPLVQEDFLTI